MKLDLRASIGTAWFVLGTAWFGVCVAAARGESLPPTLSLELGAGTNLECVLIPAGEFAMGAPDRETERQDCETPAHKVRIGRPFYMGRYEVLNAGMRAFRPGWHSAYLDGDRQPALWVSWHDADAFCRWLSEKSGRTVRLPTEAEWEYACRAGTTTRFYSGDAGKAMDSADLSKAGWYGSNTHGGSQPAGGKQPNAWGLYDMHGNAWEWCSDWFGEEYYKSSPETDPQGPPAGKARVLRGGSWLYWPVTYCRAAYRYRCDPVRRESVNGFRVVVETGPRRTAAPVETSQPWPPHRRIQPMTPESDARAAAVAARFGGPAIFVPKVKAPVVEGQISGECWKQAAPLAFRFLNGRAAPPSQPTTARLLADDTTLYVAFECAESDMARLLVHGAKRDDPVWQGDDVEIFLDPQCTAQRADAYHIAINPAGIVMDDKGGDPQWNADLKVAASRNALGWSVELAIPLADLGVSSSAVGKVWGVNLTRYRPDTGADHPRQAKLNPHSWPVDRPEDLREAEDTGWSATLSDQSGIPTRFGHALLEIGTRETAPTAPAFELVAKETFANGRGKFEAGAVVDAGYMGAGKALLLQPGEVGFWKVPLTGFRDVNLLAIVKTTPGQTIYWHTFGKLFGSNKYCCRQVTTLTRDPVRTTPWFTYSTGAGRIDFTSGGVSDEYFAGFRKHLLWHSEPSIGQIAFAGPEHWAIAYTRAGELRTQHPDNRNVDPDKDSIRGWFLHAGGKEDVVHVAGAVLFKGRDQTPPDKVRNVRVERAGDRVTLRWDPADDNTFTVWYKILDLGAPGTPVLAEAAELSVSLPLELAKGRRLAVAGVDFFENAGAPSDPVEIR